MVLTILLLLSGCKKPEVITNPNPQEEQKPHNGEHVKEEPKTSPNSDKPEVSNIRLNPSDFGKEVLDDVKWEVVTNPTGARIYVNGMFMGYSPLLFENTPPDGTAVVAIKENYQMHFDYFVQGLPRRSYSHIALVPDEGRYASNPNVTNTADKFPIKKVSENHWQIDNVKREWSFQRELIIPNDDASKILIKFKKLNRVSNNLAKYLGLINFPIKDELTILETRVTLNNDQYWSSYDIHPVAWLDNEKIVVLKGAENPDGSDPYDLGFYVEAINVKTGNRRNIKWLQNETAGKDLFYTWLSKDKKELYLCRGTYGATLESICLETGAVKLIKSGLQYFELGWNSSLFISPSGDYVVYDSNINITNSGMILNMKTGKEVEVAPKGYVSEVIGWSSAQDYLAVKVGKPKGAYEILPGHDGYYFLADEIWVLNKEGKIAYKIAINGKKIGNAQWSPDGNNLVFQTQNWIEDDREYRIVDWRLVGEKIYVADLKGNYKVLYENIEKKAIMVDFLDHRWLIGYYDNDQGLRIYIPINGDPPVELNHWRVASVKEGFVVQDEHNKLQLIRPDGNTKTIAQLNGSIERIENINDKWLFIYTYNSKSDHYTLNLIYLY